MVTLLPAVLLIFLSQAVAIRPLLDTLYLNYDLPIHSSNNVSINETIESSTVYWNVKERTNVVRGDHIAFIREIDMGISLTVSSKIKHPYEYVYWIEIGEMDIQKLTYVPGTTYEYASDRPLRNPAEETKMYIALRFKDRMVVFRELDLLLVDLETLIDEEVELRTGKVFIKAVFLVLIATAIYARYKGLV